MLCNPQRWTEVYGMAAQGKQDDTKQNDESYLRQGSPVLQIRAFAGAPDVDESQSPESGTSSPR